MTVSSEDVSALLAAWSGGDSEARDRLIPLVYGRLRQRAAAHLRRESPGCSLQPTALVHEVYLRLVEQHRASWKNRDQFFAIASQMMRRILVDRARTRRAAKRSGRWRRVTLDDVHLTAGAIDIDVLDLDGALNQLAAIDPRKSRIAELRCFGGLSLEETGRVEDLSVATVEREWQAARAWLIKTLRPRR
jgi:RNA polymerase sigma factor (TIGR02999 family)